MIINLNFNIEAWVKQLSIEADSEKDAVDKLMHMTLAEIVEANAIIDSVTNIKDIDTVISEYDLVVKVSKIEYDLDPEVMDIQVIEYLKTILPTEQTITLRSVTDSDDVEDLIKDGLLSENDYDVKSFDFQILEKK